MKSSDPASLQNLNDIILPAAVGWWPLAVGWYFLIALMLLVLVWFSYQWLHGWVKNRYRRAALRELQVLEVQIHKAEERDANLRQIPILLKRAALSVYPRSQVASLSGEDWFNFLNSTVSNPAFTGSTATTLNTVSYSTSELSAIDAHAAAALLYASRKWLQNHQPTASPTRRQDI